MAEKIAATALKTTGVAVRRGFGIASAQIGAQNATGKTKTESHTLSNDSQATPLLSSFEGEAADGQTTGHLDRKANRLASKLKPKPKPNPKQFGDGDVDTGEEEQIRLIDEAARTQSAAGANGGDGASGEEDEAYNKFVAAHPEWYQTMPDDANLFQKVWAGPVSIWLYFKRMSDNFGFGFCLAVVFTYGLNQGTGNAFYNFATMFYFVDVLQVSPARFAEFQGLAHVPWDIKALFGMVSDMWPICGYRLSPYIIISGVCGAVGMALLAFFPIPAIPAAFCLLCINFGIATPDVMVDGGIAIRMKSHPALASDLQTLCWMSSGLFGMCAALIQGPIIDNYGPQALYKMAILPIGVVVIPAALGWLREERLPPGQRNPKCSVCADRLRDQQQAPIFRMAIYLGVTALGLGLMSTFLTEDSNPWNDVIPAEMVKAIVVLVCSVVIGILIWWNLGKVGDSTGNLGKCAMYMYLRAATTPGASVMFYWFHVDDSHDKCLPIDDFNDPGCEEIWFPGTGWEAACTAEPACEIVTPEWYGWCPTTDCPDCLPWDDCTSREAVGEPCGDTQRPCLSATFLGNISIAGYAMLSVSVAIYNKWMSGWSYRTIFMWGHILSFAWNFTDLIWINRWNISVGVSDKMFVLTEEVLAPILDKFLSMPMFIIVAALAPEGCEVTMFALNMAISNFGGLVSGYFGVALLYFLGGVGAPSFDGVIELTVIRGICRLIPLLLVPFLIPVGNPRSNSFATAKKHEDRRSTKKALAEKKTESALAEQLLARKNAGQSSSADAYESIADRTP